MRGPRVWGKRGGREKENVQSPGEKEVGGETIARRGIQKASRKDREETGGGKGGKGPLLPRVRPVQLGAPGPRGSPWPARAEFPWRKRKARGGGEGPTESPRRGLEAAHLPSTERGAKPFTCTPSTNLVASFVGRSSCDPGRVVFPSL